jgi:hypothetical protein
MTPDGDLRPLDTTDAAVKKVVQPAFDPSGRSLHERAGRPISLNRPWR